MSAQHGGFRATLECAARKDSVTGHGWVVVKQYMHWMQTQSTVVPFPYSELQGQRCGLLLVMQAFEQCGDCPVTFLPGGNLVRVSRATGAAA